MPRKIRAKGVHLLLVFLLLLIIIILVSSCWLCSLALASCLGRCLHSRADSACQIERHRRLHTPYPACLPMPKPSMCMVVA